MAQEVVYWCSECGLWDEEGAYHEGKCPFCKAEKWIKYVRSK